MCDIISPHSNKEFPLRRNVWSGSWTWNQGTALSTSLVTVIDFLALQWLVIPCAIMLVGEAKAAQVATVGSSMFNT
jgi:hypothetical protein